MKRFTETLKWSDPWFRRLSGPAKLLWLYTLDHCDNIGLVEIDLGLVSKDCGVKITEATITELGNRLEVLGDGKFFLPKFIGFQYGQLSASCPAHKKVIQAVENHCLLQDSLGYHYPSARVTVRVVTTLQDSTGRGKEEESKDRGCKGKGSREELAAYAVEIGLPASDGESMFDHWSANGWKNGSEPSRDWQAGIRKWKSHGWLPSQSAKPGGLSKAKHPAFSTSAATAGLSGQDIGQFAPDQL